MIFIDLRFSWIHDIINEDIINDVMDLYWAFQVQLNISHDLDINI